MARTPKPSEGMRRFFLQDQRSLPKDSNACFQEAIALPRWVLGLLVRATQKSCENNKNNTKSEKSALGAQMVLSNL